MASTTSIKTGDLLFFFKNNKGQKIGRLEGEIWKATDS